MNNNEYGDPKAKPLAPYKEDDDDKNKKELSISEAFDNLGSAPMPSGEGKGPCNVPSPSNDNPFEY